jgi:predicted acyl esterase
MQKTKRAKFRLTRRSVLVFVAFLLSLALVAPAVIAAENYEIAVIRNVEAKMRDGVTLRADIYRPKADGKFPVLLMRTPYDKQWVDGFGQKAAARGYVVIA